MLQDFSQMFSDMCINELRGGSGRGTMQPKGRSGRGRSLGRGNGWQAVAQKQTRRAPDTIICAYFFCREAYRTLLCPVIC